MADENVKDMENIEHPCPKCGKVWRIPAGHIGQDAECGTCGTVFTVKYVATQEAEPTRPTEKRKPLSSFSSRKEVVGACLILVLFIFFLMWLGGHNFRGCLSSRRTSPPPREVAKKYHNPTLGEIVRISYKNPQVVVYGAVDDKSWDEMNSAITARDAAGLDSLKSSGKVLVVKQVWEESGPKAKVIETGWTSHKVRLMSGSHDGKAVWVPMEAIQSAKEAVKETTSPEKEPIRQRTAALTKGYFPLVHDAKHTYTARFRGKESTYSIICMEFIKDGVSYFYFVQENGLDKEVAAIASVMFGTGVYLMEGNNLYTIEAFWKKDLEKVSPSRKQVILSFPLVKGDKKIFSFGKPKEQTCFTVMGFEKVTVPAGTFNCVKVMSEKTWPDNTKDTGYAWFGKDIGLVKWERPTGRVDELVSFSWPEKEAPVSAKKLETWRIRKTWKGNTPKTTEKFLISTDVWQVKWVTGWVTKDGKVVTGKGEADNKKFQIHLYKANGGLVQVVVNVTGKDAGSVVMHGQGEYYLEVVDAAQRYTVFVETKH